MSGLPTISVKLDDVNNGGTWPYDVTAYVNIGEDGGGGSPITITRGRSDETSSVQPSQLSLTFDNTDGRFTLGSTVGGYGAINNDRRIQVKYTVSGVTTTRFTGYVKNWPTNWPGGYTSRATAPIVAVDYFERLQRHRLRDMLYEMVNGSGNGLVAYYRLNEPSGATYCTNIAPYNQPNLDPKGYPVGTGLTFGSPSFGNGPSGGDTTAGIHIIQRYSYLFGSGAYVNGGTAASAFTLGLWIRCGNPISGGDVAVRLDGPGNARVDFIIASGGNAQAKVTTDAGNTYTATNTTIPIGDQALHYVMIVCNFAASTVEMCVDYSSRTSVATAASQTLTLDNGLIYVGGVAQDGFLSGTSADYYDLFWCTTALDLNNQEYIYTGGLTGLDNNDTQVWTYAIARWGGIPYANMSLDTGHSTLNFMDSAGSSPAAMLDTVNQHEGGLIYIAGNGWFVFEGRYHRGSPSLNQLTLTAADIDDASEVVSDTQYVVNYALGTRPNGYTEMYAQSSSSVATHDHYVLDFTSSVYADYVQVQDAMWWNVNTRAEPAPRFPTLTIDLMTSSTTIQQNVQAVELSDRITVTGMPTQTPGGTTVDVFAEGWQESLSASHWTVVFNTSPFSYSNPIWILDNTTYSVEGTTTRLAH